MFWYKDFRIITLIILLVAYIWGKSKHFIELVLIYNTIIFIYAYINII